MLQELAARTGTAAWAIGSMFFFLAMFVAIVVWVFLKRPEEMAKRARMPLEGDGEQGSGAGDQGSGIGDQGSGSGSEDQDARPSTLDPEP